MKEIELAASAEDPSHCQRPADEARTSSSQSEATHSEDLHRRESHTPSIINEIFDNGVKKLYPDHPFNSDGMSFLNQAKAQFARSSLNNPFEQAQDVFQESISSFLARHKKGDGFQALNPEAYFQTCLRNNIHDRFRKERDHNKKALISLEEQIEGGYAADVVASVDHSKHLEIILKAIMLVENSRHRDYLIARYLKGLSPREIREEWEISESAESSLARRARKSLIPLLKRIAEKTAAIVIGGFLS